MEDSATLNFFSETVKASIRAEVEAAIAEEAEAAADRVQERVKSLLDRIALDVFANYEISQMQNRLIIEVKKP